MSDLHVELLKQAVDQPPATAGLPPQLRAMHLNVMRGIRRDRIRRKTGGPDHPWGPGSKPEPTG